MTPLLPETFGIGDPFGSVFHFTQGFFIPFVFPIKAHINIAILKFSVFETVWSFGDEDLPTLLKYLSHQLFYYH